MVDPHEKSPAKRATPLASDVRDDPGVHTARLPLKSVQSVPHNLPIQVTSFIGRATEIAEVKRLILSNRLLTLTGAGGCGKSRLALQVAAELLRDFPDGVWVVEFAALFDSTLVSKTLASTLRVAENPRRPIIETLKSFLRPKSILLLFDNCEHLLPACAGLVDALIRECPGVRVLATSREGLRIQGEFNYRVPSLALPDLNPLPPLEQVRRCEAVRLFAERAMAILRSFRVKEQNAQAVAQVCCHLDGIPLAIEMAAARVKVLSAEQIAARLDNRFGLLADGFRTALPRHQTLRAAMDWSYDLLAEKERVFLHRLSVFAGGWTLEAADAVCAGAGVERSDILDLLAQLVEKSLVVTVETRQGSVRYRLLETVRQYARDKLQESGEADRVRRCHREWYLGLAERAEQELRGPRQEEWLEQLEAEHDNLRTALEMCKTAPDGAEAGSRLAGALHWFWSMHGYWSEARQWLDEALGRIGEASPSSLTKTIKAAAYFAWRKGEYGLAVLLGDRGIALCRELGDRENGAQLLIWLGIVAMRQGNYERATALYEESVSLCHEVGKTWLSSMAISQLGTVARDLGDYERAVALHLQALALARSAGDKALIASQLRNLGTNAHCQRDYDRAAAYHSESLAVSSEIGSRWLIEECLRGLARVASAQQHYQRAARLLGAAELLREILGWQIAPNDLADQAECVTSTRVALGDAAFASAWTEGRAMTVEDATDYALAVRAGIPTKRAKRPMREREPSVLTPRERQIAVLIARGLTNREIAAALVITGRTAESHVQHILDKLGFRTRSQAAAWAVEQGLHKSP